MKIQSDNLQYPAYVTGNNKLDKAIVKSLNKGPGHLANPVLLKVLDPVIERVNKYHVKAKEKRTYKDGTVFSSKKEMDRWDELLMVERGELIKDLQKQVKFIIHDAFESKQYGMSREIKYIADFTYLNNGFRKDLGNVLVVEDVKGDYKEGRTDVYQIKRKMFLKKYPMFYFFEV